MPGKREISVGFDKEVILCYSNNSTELFKDTMMKSHIVEEMLKKAETAEKNGDKASAEYWLKRASEVEESLKNNEANSG